MTGMINFYCEDINYRLRGIRHIRAWMLKCISQQNRTAGEVSIIFCSDEFLYNMNVEYLHHDTLTDVITFDYSAGDTISGDVFISIPRVKENAALYGKTFSEELNRVMIHGILHLCGYKDETRKEATLMRSKEEECLALFA
ncbi:Endoribonuclease YbeY [bioreactor metagenome]|jgi:rRNA maturation RNase YbeY|uniref:Endoribonuclease YbeY n=2 Tax=root TaxID=1 RepID=A0A644U8B0_9ZZZZ